MGNGAGRRVAVDWHQVGRPNHDETDTGRYQQGLTASLATGVRPGDDVWALVAWPGAVDAVGPGIGHAGIGHREAGRNGRDVRRMLMTLRPDVAVFAHIAPPGLPVPFALVMHDALFATHPEWLGPGERERTVARSTRTVARAQFVIAVSEVTRIDVLSVLDLSPERVVVIPPAPSPAFAPEPAARARIASRYGLDRYCVAIGGTGARGNLANLAEAAAQLDDRGLVMVSPQRPPRGRQDIPGIRFLGPLGDADRADLLAAARLAAAVSFYDGCGLGALEALACGTPLIVSDRGALREVVGEAALVTPPSVNAIAEGLRALQDPAVADRLRAAGPLRAASYSSTRLGAAAWAAIRGAVSAGR
jgi:glycosyltransferase involved in cell wall biosynthesis